MQVRLAFSVMVQVDADILLIDEVLAVGDVGFQQKCFDVFNRLRDEGKTILFVTHDMGAVRRFCHRAVLLERGEGRARSASPARWRPATWTSASARGGEDAASRRGRPQRRRHRARSSRRWWEDEHGERQTVLHQGRPCSFHARVRFAREVDESGASRRCSRTSTTSR